MKEQRTIKLMKIRHVGEAQWRTHLLWSPSKPKGKEKQMPFLSFHYRQSTLYINVQHPPPEVDGFTGSSFPLSFAAIIHIFMSPWHHVPKEAPRINHVQKFPSKKYMHKPSLFAVLCNKKNEI